MNLGNSMQKRWVGVGCCETSIWLEPGRSSPSLRGHGYQPCTWPHAMPLTHLHIAKNTQEEIQYTWHACRSTSAPTSTHTKQASIHFQATNAQETSKHARVLREDIRHEVQTRLHTHAHMPVYTTFPTSLAPWPLACLGVSPLMAMECGSGPRYHP